jgi:serine/threonine protein kinase
MRFGPYKLTRRHAIGGMSSVFIAEDELLNREVALKILSEEYSQDEKRITAFEEEARLTASFSHPHVVKIFTTGYAFGRFYIAMEFVPGGHFEHRIRERGKLSEEEALPLAVQIAEGLKGAQSAGLIHRDIKPGNILFDSEDNAKIVDFGLALVTKGGKAKAEEIWATPYYVPPEAIEGQVEDFRSDIYAFGSTLYHALAGIPPCDEESMDTKLLRAAKQKVVPLKRVAPHLTHETCAVIDKAMAYEADNRFGSYDEMVAALKNAIKAVEGAGDLDTRIKRSKAELRNSLRAKKKRGLLTAVGAVIGAVSLVIIAIVVISEPKETLKPLPKIVEMTPANGSAAGRSADIGKQYLEARSAMKRGAYAEAERMFLDLFSAPATAEPTRTWAGLEAVAASFMDGRSSSANMYVRILKMHIESSPEGLDSEFKRELVPVLGKMRDLPFIRMESMELNGTKNNDVRLMAHWLAGLKNWNQGALSQAVPFFKEVREQPASGKPGMLAWYRQAAGRYLSDYALLDSDAFGPLPKTIQQCRETTRELEAILGKLKTRGRASFNVRSRILDLELLRQELVKRQRR